MRKNKTKKLLNEFLKIHLNVLPLFFWVDVGDLNAKIKFEKSSKVRSEA